MTPRRAARVQHLTQSEIRAMTRECVKVGGINLGQGVCDLPTPEVILQATSRAILGDLSTYSKFEGIDPLREQIALKSMTFNKIPEVDPDHHVVVTVGATGALACCVQALFDPGDEFILFEPYYGYHVNTLKVGGCVPNFVTLHPEDGWALTPQMLEDALTPRTKAVLFSNPTNPSGKVWSRKDLDIVADFCISHDLLALSDEIYEYITYADAPHISLASLPGMWERTITISGFSKTFSITGWRLGSVVAPAHLTQGVGLINDLFYVCAPTPLQHGLAQGMAALGETTYYADMAKDYEQKRDEFCQVLTHVGLTPHVPDGAYYVLADITRFDLPTSKDAAMHILHACGVASVPGSAFFASDIGQGLTRFCYAKDWPVLRQAMAQLETLA